MWPQEDTSIYLHLSAEYTSTHRAMVAKDPFITPRWHLQVRLKSNLVSNCHQHFFEDSWYWVGNVGVNLKWTYLNFLITFYLLKITKTYNKYIQIGHNWVGQKSFGQFFLSQTVKSILFFPFFLFFKLHLKTVRTFFLDHVIFVDD